MYYSAKLVTTESVLRLSMTLKIDFNLTNQKQMDSIETLT